MYSSLLGSFGIVKPFFKSIAIFEISYVAGVVATHVALTSFQSAVYLAGYSIRENVALYHGQWMGNSILLLYGLYC